MIIGSLFWQILFEHEILNRGNMPVCIMATWNEEINLKGSILKKKLYKPQQTKL